MMTVEEVEEITEYTEVISGAVETAIGTNILLAMLMGFGMQNLFGLIRQLAYFVLVALVAVPFPSQLSMFYKLVIELSGMDLLSGPLWYEVWFKFKESSPFNENFDYMGTGDMNFMMNAASIPLLVLLMTLSALLWYLLLRVARCCYRRHLWRTVGVRAENNAVIWEPLVLTFTEGFVDLALPAGLSVLCVFSKVDDPSVGYWFTTFDDSFNSILGLMTFSICWGLVFWLTSLVVEHGSELASGDQKERYGFMFDGFDMRRKTARYYWLYTFYKRLIAVATLIILDGHPLL